MRVTYPSFSSAVRYSRERINLSEINHCGVPHIVVDEAIPPTLIAAINDHWPDKKSFEPEIPGNFICNIRRRRYLQPNLASRLFWIGFNEFFWPSLVASCGESLITPLENIFGNLIFDSFRYAKTLTLMEADETFSGHQPHTHFYHNPNWTFTILLYVDPTDITSEGTTFNGLGLPACDNRLAENQSNYTSGTLSQRLNSATTTLQWSDLPPAKTVPYKAGRLLIMLDGPLSFHSVKQKNAATDSHDQPSLPKLQRRQRRILRTHTCVVENRFYRFMADKTGRDVSPEVFKKAMASNRDGASSNKGDQTALLMPLLQERLVTYASAMKETSDHVEDKMRSDSLHRTMLNQLRVHQW